MSGDKMALPFARRCSLSAARLNSPRAGPQNAHRVAIGLGMSAERSIPELPHLLLEARCSQQRSDQAMSRLRTTEL